MTNELDLLGMFEGMEPSQAKELTARIKSAIKREYQNFQKGVEPMPELNELFEGMGYEEVVEALRAYKQPKQEAQEQSRQLDEQEAAEIADLQKRVRGTNYAIEKRNIQARYARMRNQKPAEVDPEIEKARKDNTLPSLYRQRLEEIEKRPVARATKLHEAAELKATFRKEGLQV